MKNKITALIASLFLILSFNTLQAETNFGISLMTGQAETSGSEKEDGSADDKNNKTIKETFMGGSLYLEHVSDNGVAIGIDYVPLEVELGDGKRTDSSAGADAESEADTGDRKASASLENLITLYASFPLNVGDLYGKVGYHMVDVTTSETLPNAAYGDDDITGFQVALGKSFDRTKLEIFYSDFEEVSLTATGGSGSHKIEADADVLGLKLSIDF